MDRILQRVRPLNQLYIESPYVFKVSRDEVPVDVVFYDVYRFLSSVFLLQGPSRQLTHWINMTARLKMNTSITLFLLSFDKPLQPESHHVATTIFAPNSTWTVGRNLLLHQMLVYELQDKTHCRRFKYVLFADGDTINFSCQRHPNCYAKRSILNSTTPVCCFDSMIELLLHSEMEYALVHFFVYKANVTISSSSEIPLVHYDW